MGYREAYAKWLGEDGLDASLREELVKINGDERDVEDRFYKELDFGTAGLRGIIGAGTNRINVYIVRRATQGLALYLKRIAGAAERGVAIAFDSRRMSARFARETALVLAANGIRAYLFETLRSVPQLSFTIRHLNCIAGVVITASHNPAQYNGYKVYWEHGGQMGPEQAEEVTGYIRSLDLFEARPMDENEAVEKGLLTYIGRAVDEAYYEATETLLLHPDLVKRKGSDLSIVYTPLYGSGNVPVRAMLERIGITNVSVVKEQETPDPAFPGLSAPNPEDPKAFELAVELANQTGADVILATDPDSDRLGVAVRGREGNFTVLSGNQIGSLLIQYILSSKKADGALISDSLVVKSIVSTRMADAICARYGVQIKEVLTGFRFISEIIDQCHKMGTPEFLFGFEESYGFLAGGFSRDKDAICAAMLVAEACVFYKELGKTLFDVLQEMYALYGWYQEGVISYTLEGKSGMERIGRIMSRLRERPMDSIAGIRVSVMEDFLPRKRIHIDGAIEEEIQLPASNVLRYMMNGDAWLCVRPSGTEPKLKLYAGIRGKDEQGAGALLQNMLDYMDKVLSQIN